MALEPLGSSAGVALAFRPQGGKHLSVPLLTGSGRGGQPWAEAGRKTCHLLAVVSLDLMGQECAAASLQGRKRVGALGAGVGVAPR